MTIVESWTIDSYFAAVASGEIDGRRTTLLRGRVGEKVVSGERHARAVRRLHMAIGKHLVLQGLDARYEVAAEQAVRLAANNHLPEPDIAIAPATDHGHFMLADCLAIIEIADSTVRSDENVKHAESYDHFDPYWVIGLERQTLRRYSTDGVGVDTMIFHIPEIGFSLSQTELFQLIG